MIFGPNEIRLYVSPERIAALNWEQWIALETLGEGGPATMKPLRTVVQHFMVNDKGEFLSDPEAWIQLRLLRTPQILEVAQKLAEAIKGMAVSPTTGSGS